MDPGLKEALCVTTSCNFADGVFFQMNVPVFVGGGGDTAHHAKSVKLLLSLFCLLKM